MRFSFALVLCTATLFIGGVTVLPRSGHDLPRNPAAQAGDGEDYLSQDIEPADPRSVEQVAGADIQPAGLLCCLPDERVQVTDTTVASFIVYLELYDIFGFIVGSCTGTFIGPDTVLTAGHCLYDNFTWTANIRVVPAKNGFSEPLGSQFAVNWWVPDGWILFENTLFDWGVIKMPDSTLGNAAHWLTVAVATTDTLSRPDFNPAIIGYPGDKPFGTMWLGFKDSFVLVGVNNLYYDIDTSGGQSGSAIFSSNTGGKPFFAWVVGVHTTGGSFWNSGIRINVFQLNDILEGCVQMACTIEWLIESAATPTQAPTPAATQAPTPTPTPSPTPPVLPPTPNPTAAGVSQKWADLNCNGSVGPVDALLALRFDAGLSTSQSPGCPPIGAVTQVTGARVAGGSELVWGDVDCSGEVNPVDALKLLRYDAGLTVNQPAGCPQIGSSVLV